MASCREVDALVTPYIDGEATAAERAVVDAHLKACPPCRHRALVETAARETLRTRFCRPCAPEQLRAQCLEAAAKAGVGRIRGSRISLSSLPMLAALIVLGGALVFGLTRLSPTVLAAQLTLDHIKCFALDRSENPVDARASEEQFAHDYGWQVHVPAPTLVGLQLVSVRRCFCGEGSAAHLMYRFHGRPVSLYILPDVNRARASADAFGHETIIWSKQGNTYVLVGKETDEALQQLASDFSQSL